MVFLVVSVVTGVFLVRASYPGGFNDDMVFQLRQAQGEIPFNDWHPVIQALLWKWLIAVTGDIGSLLVLQVVGFELAAFGLASYIFRETGRAGLSFLGFVVLLAPWIMNFAGMVWKDTGMAVCLFLVVVISLHLKKAGWLRWPLFGFAILLLIYATIVRKNAFFAILPILWFLSVSVSRGRPGSWFSVSVPASLRSFRALVPSVLKLTSVSVVFVLVAIGASAAIDSATRPVRTHQIAQVFMDDLSFTLTARQLDTEPMPERVRTDLKGIRKLCPLDGSNQISNAYWRCYRNNSRSITFAPIDDADALQELWIRQVTSHPVRYLRYRTLVYARFLFATNYQYEVPQKDLPAQLQKANPAEYQIQKAYVVNFGLKSLAWTYQVWFWLIASILGCVFARRIRGARLVTLTLSVSSLLYLVGYFPIVPASNLRYAYWPAVAMTMVAVLAIASYAQRRRTPPPLTAADSTSS